MLASQPKQNALIALVEYENEPWLLKRKASFLLEKSNEDTRKEMGALWNQVLHAHLKRISESMTPSAHMASSIMAADMAIVGVAERIGLPTSESLKVRQVSSDAGPTLSFACTGMSDVDADKLQEQIRSFMQEAFKSIVSEA